MWLYLPRGHRSPGVTEVPGNLVYMGSGDQNSGPDAYMLFHPLSHFPGPKRVWFGFSFNTRVA